MDGSFRSSSIDGINHGQLYQGSCRIIGTNKTCRHDAATGTISITQPRITPEHTRGKILSGLSRLYSLWNPDHTCCFIKYNSSSATQCRKERPEIVRITSQPNHPIKKTPRIIITAPVNLSRIFSSLNHQAPYKTPNKKLVRLRDNIYAA